MCSTNSCFINTLHSLNTISFNKAKQAIMLCWTFNSSHNSNTYFAVQKLIKNIVKFVKKTILLPTLLCRSEPPVKASRSQVRTWLGSFHHSPSLLTETCRSIWCCNNNKLYKSMYIIIVFIFFLLVIFKLLG